jgi:Ser/Thr protein kinase RdoA (MazF antagonist)
MTGAGSGAHSVHSMGLGAAEPNWPRLTLLEVQEVLRRWDVDPEHAALRWHSPRPLSTAAIVDLGAGALFVKRHDRRIRDVAGLEEEHRFIAHLLERGAAVTAVRTASDGHTAWSVGAMTYEVHDLGSGVDLYRDAVSWSPFTSTAHAFSAGAALAGLHWAAQGYGAAPRSTALLVSNDRVINAAAPLEAVDELLAVRPALFDYLSRRAWREELGAAIAPFHAAYRQLAPELPSLWTHNDWHASNLLWSDPGDCASVASALDFGLSDRTTRIYDLATAIERNTIPWLDIQDGRDGPALLAQVDALLDGYSGTAALSALECAALVAVLPIVHLGYALTEIDYFHGITGSTANAELAYDGFLLGHCRWFGRAHGTALLAHLRERLGVAHPGIAPGLTPPKVSRAS